ncbi:MAG: MFS transporter [Lachnospiraceae bacterium]|jgi:PPP family 3-phenylpropionic acid transporter
MKTNNKFPFLLFTVYVVYYAGQALQSGYESLFLSQNGLKPAQIGTVTFVVTIGTIILQTLAGIVSDRAKYKNIPILMLYVGSFVFALLLTKFQSSYLAILIFLTLFMGCFNPLIPLSDDFSIRALKSNIKFDYGSVRMGGTIGYAAMMLVSGYILNDTYHNIFLIVAVTLALGFVLFLFAPKVEKEDTGSKKKNQERVGIFRSIRLIAGNHTYFIIVMISVLLATGQALYGSYYSIYYMTIGGNSRMLGIMQFVSAISEVPCLFAVGKVVKKIGTGKTLALSAAFAAARWMLLYLTANPVLSIFIGLLHGFGFAWSNYCVVSCISECLNENVRASGQVLKTTISLIFSRAVFGYLGGILYETYGARSLMLISALFAGMAAIFTWIWSRRAAGRR